MMLSRKRKIVKAILIVSLLAAFFPVAFNFSLSGVLNLKTVSAIDSGVLNLKNLTNPNFVKSQQTAQTGSGQVDCSQFHTIKECRAHSKECKLSFSSGGRTYTCVNKSSSPASAASTSGKVAKGIFGFIVAISSKVALLFAAIGGFFIFLTGKLFQWAVELNGTIMDNWFLQQGWIVVRDFANLFFALAMIAIGISTIVGYKEYEAQKILTKLILIALIINFSFMICGVLVDFGQAIMNYFKSGIAAGTKFGNLTDGVMKMLSPQRIFGPDTNAQISKMLEGDFGALKALGSGSVIGLAGILFSIFLVITMNVVLFGMAALFTVRFIVLSMLIILAPIAWVLVLLPAIGGEIGGMGKKWWDEFLKWLLFGPAMMFFIWLAMLLVHPSSSALVAEKIQTGLSQKEAATMSLSHFTLASIGNMVIVLGFLLAGMKIALSFGVHGAEAFNKAANWSYKKSGGWLKKKYSGYQKGASEWVKARTAGAIKGTSEKLSESSRRGTGAALRLVPGKKWAIKKLSKASEELAKDAEAMGKEFSASDLAAMYRSKRWKPLRGLEGAVPQNYKVLAALAGAGGLLSSGLYPREELDYIDDKIAPGYISGRYIVANKNLEKALAEGKLDEVMGEYVRGLDSGSLEGLSIGSFDIYSNLDKIERGEIPGLDKDAASKIIKSFEKNMVGANPKGFASFIERLGKERSVFLKRFKERLEEEAAAAGKNREDYLRTINPSLANWLGSNAAQNLGINKDDILSPPHIITAG